MWKWKFNDVITVALCMCMAGTTWGRQEDIPHALAPVGVMFSTIHYSVKIEGLHAHHPPLPTSENLHGFKILCIWNPVWTNIRKLTIQPGCLQVEHPYWPLYWRQFMSAALAGKSTIAQSSWALTTRFPMFPTSTSIPVSTMYSVYVCLSSPSFSKQSVGYGMSMSDHRAVRWCMNKLIQSHEAPAPMHPINVLNWIIQCMYI